MNKKIGDYNQDDLYWQICKYAEHVNASGDNTFAFRKVEDPADSSATIDMPITDSDAPESEYDEEAGRLTLTYGPYGTCKTDTPF